MQKAEEEARTGSKRDIYTTGDKGSEGEPRSEATGERKIEIEREGEGGEGAKVNLKTNHEQRAQGTGGTGIDRLGWGWSAATASVRRNFQLRP